MLTIRYSVGAEPCSDHLAEMVVREAYRKSIDVGDETVATSSEVVITAARCLVAEGVISPERVAFEYHSFREHPDACGRLEMFDISGFVDTIDKFENRIEAATEDSSD